MSIHCRIAIESDANDIASLVNRAYRPASPGRGWTHEAHLVAGDRISPEQIRALIHTHATVLVLCRDSDIVACVQVQRDAAVASISLLATDPDWQAHGFGKSMLQHAETFAKADDPATVIQLSVLAARPELIAFYERRGYARTGQIQDYPVQAGAGQPRVAELKLEVLAKRATRSGG